jgi:primase-polymerase (primpol)-like protein
MNNLLCELKKYPNFVVCYTLDKIPLNPVNGERAAVNDSSTWGTFEIASACLAKDSRLTLGFVLTPNDPYVCVDLDTYKTTDPTIIQRHKEIYEALNSYSELSPHGGVHIWVKGKLNAGKKLSKEFIEVYPFSRYITITGDVVNPAPIVERQNELEALVGHIETVVASSWVGAAQTKTDEEICKMAAEASNGNLFMRLWYGDWAGMNYPSQSEGDLAFLNIVAFYTDNKEQVARIYFNSPLFQNSPKRKRKARPDYLFHEKYGLITKAFDQKNYFPELEAMVKAHVDAKVTEQLATPILKDFDIKDSIRESLPQFIKEPKRIFLQ